MWAREQLRMIAVLNHSIMNTILTQCPTRPPHLSQFHLPLPFPSLLPSHPLTSPQPWCTLLPTAAFHWLSQEFLPLLPPSVCRLLLQQATSQPLSSGLHAQLLYGSSPIHHLSLCTARGVRHDSYHPLRLLWPIQVH